MHFIANLQSPKQIVPAIGPFDHPTPGLESRIVLAFLFFLPARLHVRHVPSTFRRLAQFRIVVSFVATKMLAGPLLRRPTSNDHGVQGRAELLHVVPIRSRERDRQRDAVRVGEQVPLGAQFASIRRVFADLIPLLTGAETVALSSDWKCQSIPWRSS